MFKNALLLACLMTSVVARVAAAGDVLYYGTHDMPDPDVVARILSEPAKAARPIKMRSIRLLDEPGAQPAQVAASTPAPQAPAYANRPLQTASYTATDYQTDAYTGPAEPGPSALGLPVQFAFDSAELMPQALAQLDALAEGIRRADPGVRVVVEGHTDAVGSADYNLRLSQLRAQSVKTYLVSRHAIDPARLRVVGKGEFAPIEGSDPFAAQNRRVEFRADLG
ncbi:MAG TPA: OmpA family protein [Rhodocyclaceae bacterium]|nr:OmpA family protein [Rhodocyclaceae bacterium]